MSESASSKPAEASGNPSKPEGGSIKGKEKPAKNVKKPQGDKAQNAPKKDGKEKNPEGKAKPDSGKKPEGTEGEQKSKAQLKAERRAVQEAQRAAKAKQKEGGGGAKPAAPQVKKETAAEKPVSKQVEAGQGDKKAKKKVSSKDVIKGETEEEMWTRREKEMLSKSLKMNNNIVNLGFQYYHHNIVGANARCIAMLGQLKELISTYRTPPEKELCRDLEKSLLAPCITYLNFCRPLSTSMGNAIKHLKFHVSRIPNDMEDRKAIETLQDVIETFIQENIMKASEAVAHYANTKIVDGDVILVYAASSLICEVLKTAHKKGKKFRVIVVEGRLRTEGKSMLRFLVRCGIPCSYMLIGSATHAMGEATKVFLGAAAMFSIGDMHSRSGNSMIAALAQAHNLPVLVCCETYKFTDKVRLHSTDSNLDARGTDIIEAGLPNRPSILLTNENTSGDSNVATAAPSPGTAAVPTQKPHLLNLMYDVTRSQHITALVTELGMLPCSSVPVVLRRQEDLASEAL